jgi:hypothetical protein
MRLDIKKSSFDRDDHFFFLQKESVVSCFSSGASPDGFGGIDVASIKAS